MASGINYRLIRLADIYLMYAECLIKGGASDGNVQSAINAINKVRHRAGVVLIGKSEQGEFKRYTYDEKEYAASDVMNHLMYVERPLELCMEGHAIRVIDLRRWNITKERFDQLASDEYKYCMIQTKYLKPNPDDLMLWYQHSTLESSTDFMSCRQKREETLLWIISKHH